MIKILIADNEKLARETIKGLLYSQKDIGEIIEAETGNQVLELCQQHNPDIIYLDILISGKTGIQLAEELPKKPLIIFATAHEKYAITAFNLNAIDYLLKPFDDDRFYASLNKARKQIQGKNSVSYKNLNSIIKQLINENTQIYKSRLVIKDPGRIRLIDTQDIEYISGAGNYADVFLSDGNHILHRETLTTLEKQLDPHKFIRIHRSSIVKKTSITELRPNEKGDYTVILKNGQHLTLSRRNRVKLEEILTH